MSFMTKFSLGGSHFMIDTRLRSTYRILETFQINQI